MNDVTTKPVAATPARALFGERSPMHWLRGEIDRLFDDFGQPGRSLFDFSGGSIGPVPALALVDEGKSYRLSAELPGLSEKDLSIELADGVLTIAGEKKDETERKEDGYLLNERRYGKFSRQIALPADADADEIKAAFKDGVLTVTIDKDEKAAARARRIEIGG